MTKNEFITKRTEIISTMLDNPDDCGIYPTTNCFDALDKLFDDIKADSYQETCNDMLQEITNSFMRVKSRTMWRLIDIIDILSGFQQEE